jgi:hypothetical protein
VGGDRQRSTGGGAGGWRPSEEHGRHRTVAARWSEELRRANVEELLVLPLLFLLLLVLPSLTAAVLVKADDVMARRSGNAGTRDRRKATASQWTSVVLLALLLGRWRLDGRWEEDAAGWEDERKKRPPQ